MSITKNFKPSTYEYNCLKKLLEFTLILTLQPRMLNQEWDPINHKEVKDNIFTILLDYSQCMHLSLEARGQGPMLLYELVSRIRV